MRSKNPVRLVAIGIATAMAVSTIGTAAQAASDDTAQAQAAINVATAGMGTPAAGNSAQVSVPAMAGQELRITGPQGAIAVGLPGTAAAVHTTAGTVIYPSAAKSADVAVQTLTDGTVRALVVIGDQAAPTEYRFPMTLPAGARLAEISDGGVAIVTDSAMIGLISTPWAKDAKGAAVPTRYRIEGNTLIQEVDHRGAAYPVVADPTFGWSSWPVGPVAYLNKSETSTIANGDITTLAGIIAGMFAANPVMGAAMALQIYDVKSWASQAQRQNKCVKYVFEGIIFGDVYSGGNCH